VPEIQFIREQLTKIDSKLDGIDTRLRHLEINIVNKGEIDKLRDRIVSLENFRFKFVFITGAALFLFQLALNLLMKKFQF
jgi:hypothetical protein